MFTTPSSLFPDIIPTPRAVTRRRATRTRFAPAGFRHVRSAYDYLHQILTQINAIGTGCIPADRVFYKKQRAYLLKLLWTYGLHGKPRHRPDEPDSLLLDSMAYTAAYLLSDHAEVRSYLRALPTVGVNTQLQPLVMFDWLTPGGNLRRMAGKSGFPAWQLTLSIASHAGGAQVLSALQVYVHRLVDQYGDAGFQYFANADMRVMQANPVQMSFQTLLAHA